MAVTSWIEVSEERLKGNYRAIAAAVGAAFGAGTDVLAVVKANAYGHGAEVCSVALARAGARWFGVADAGEGARVIDAIAAPDALRTTDPSAYAPLMGGPDIRTPETLSKYWSDIPVDVRNAARVEGARVLAARAAPPSAP